MAVSLAQATTVTIKAHVLAAAPGGPLPVSLSMVGTEKGFQTCREAHCGPPTTQTPLRVCTGLLVLRNPGRGSAAESAREAPSLPSWGKLRIVTLPENRQSRILRVGRNLCLFLLWVLLFLAGLLLS